MRDRKSLLLVTGYALIAAVLFLPIISAQVDLVGPTPEIDPKDPTGFVTQPSQPPTDGSTPPPAGDLDPTGSRSPWLGDAIADLGFGGGIAIGIAVSVAALAVGLLFAGGAKFVTGANVLENEARRTIFEYIQSHPGTHLRATATALDLSTTNVLWHLRKLEDAKLVASKKFEGYKVFYPVAGGVETKRKAIASAVLKNGNAQQILEYIAAHPSAHQREIARAMNVNHGTVRWHLRKLNEAGLLVQVKKEHTTQYYLAEEGHEFLSPGAPVAPIPAGVIPAPVEGHAHDDEHEDAPHDAADGPRAPLRDPTRS
ncbi:MAG TPA: winged helix-turn-helix transcriptional regulator [Candidatus Thermoplasmatota archaeon]|nr:winged helix-turn-helix transcriptional regulator [Candidatus Thermoplasmatota archaeon]